MGAMAAIEVQTVCQTAGAAYALFWEESGGGLVVSAKYVTPGRALTLKTTRGDDESFVSKSCAVSLRSGEGMVGRVFASKGEEFHPDARLLSVSQFPRAGAAQEFGVVGLAAVSWKGGVLEFGSTERWTDRPKVRIDMAARLKAVCSSSGAVYALFWEEGLFCEDTLTVLEHYHPLERVIGLRAQRGDDETFATRSRGFSLCKGQGLVGRVFATGGHELVSDAGKLTTERFTRAQHAKEFGIRSIACVSIGGGVLEFGTTETWEKLPNVDFPPW